MPVMAQGHCQLAANVTFCLFEQAASLATVRSAHVETGSLLFVYGNWDEGQITLHRLSAFYGIPGENSRNGF